MTEPKAEPATPTEARASGARLEPPMEQRAERPAAQHSAPMLLLDLQLGPLDAQEVAALPAVVDLRRWALAALDPRLSPRHARLHWPAELTLRLTDETESADLNQRYRGRAGPTNILSFPFEPPPGLDPGQSRAAGINALLGDLVICAPLVRREAAEQGKTETAHWAHLVVHGVLHLLGFDHLTATEAAPMEALEINILAALGFSTPYEVNDDANGERRRI
ncbi:MAG: rRNA maturation RNase YbeY [Halochromatium sp.]